MEKYQQITGITYQKAGLTLAGALLMLAPGILGLAAVLGIAATYAHPALAGKANEAHAGSSVMPLDVSRHR